MWAPVWVHNFGEVFLSSITPLLEMEHMGVLGRNRSTLLIVDLLRHHVPPGCIDQPRTPCDEVPSWLVPLLRVLALGPVSLLHTLAPPCQGDLCPPPRCFSHLRACSFRSVFTHPYPRDMDMWAAGQTIVARLAADAHAPQEPSHADAEAAVLRETMQTRADARILRVLFDERAQRGMRSRQIGNTPSLLARCALEGTSLGIECANHTFGVHGLAADVAVVRAADVLVGMHGSGLTNGFFMRRGSALIEVRPYGFEGGSANRYYKEPLEHPKGEPVRVFYMSIAIGSPELCAPNSGFAIAPQFAAYVKHCTLPWEALKRAIRVITWWRTGKPARPRAGGGTDSSPESRYAQGAWATRHMVAYAPETSTKPNSAKGSRRRSTRTQSEHLAHL